jgi:hypothetical protein
MFLAAIRVMYGRALTLEQQRIGFILLLWLLYLVLHGHTEENKAIPKLGNHTIHMFPYAITIDIFCRTTKLCVFCSTKVSVWIFTSDYMNGVQEYHIWVHNLPYSIMVRALDLDYKQCSPGKVLKL